MKFLQRLGRSLMLPVAVLPVAAILMGVSYWIEGVTGAANVFTVFINAAGGALLNNMPLLFAIGVSLGMANKTDGTSALAGLVSWLTVTTLLAPGTVAGLFGVDVESTDAAFGAVQNVFVGILCGLIGAFAYNRFKDVQLPDWLSFFSGKRSVAIMASLLSLGLGVVLLFVWPFVYQALVTFGEWIVTLGPWGAGLYGFFNRLLIPIGLHHALNSVFWFDVAGINDLNNFLQGVQVDSVFGGTGVYMTGFFPIMMFGLPGAALAMYLAAKKSRKKYAYGILLSAAIASFFVGVTEPLEFSFMFLAPVLYVTHAAFTGISMIIAAFLPVRMGFGFSAGFIDLVLGWINPVAQNPWIILVLGVFWFFVYLGVFYWMITKFNLKTPGREDEDVVDEVGGEPVGLGEDKYRRAAAAFVAALGGPGNITEVDNCATRLRLEVADTSLVDDAALKRGGAIGSVRPGGSSVQVIYGTSVQFVKDAMDEILTGTVAMPDTIEVAPAGGPAAVAGGTGTLAPTAAPAVVRLRQPIEGEVISLAEVPDPMFAEGTMGPGIAIRPTGDTVIAPADGTVASVFPTGHAIGLVLDDGTELLIHVGIDTVNLKGDGFETLVAAGDKVVAGQPLLRFDAATITAAGLSTDTPVIVLNNENAKIRFA